MIDVHETAPSLDSSTGEARVFSYVVAYDNGFAPNPFHGFLTLACCKPKIRQTAHCGDIIVGLSRRCERVIYAMQVADIIGFHEYWEDPRYSAKRPTWDSPHLVDRNGDNIYEPVGHEFRQMRSWHSNPDGSENPGDKRRDLGQDHGNSVLVSEHFIYWGGSGPLLPAELGFLSVRRAHRCRFTVEQVEAVRHWFSSQPRGMLGAPSNWRAGDDSWRDS